MKVRSVQSFALVQNFALNMISYDVGGGGIY